MKKAISPLVSTIVLIVFATVLGVLVMGWGKSYAPEAQESCDDASLKLIMLNNKPLACYSGDTFYATIENDGQSIINGLIVSSIGDSIETTPIEIKIPVATVAKIDLFADNPKKLIITPKINERLCPKKQIEIENIMPC